MMDGSRPFFACLVSKDLGEQLFGTASPTEVWVLLEYRGGWGREAFAEAEIPQDVKDRLNIQLKSIPRSRMQLIKHARHLEGSLAFYVAVARESDRRLYRFWMAHYEHIQAIDLLAVVADDPKYADAKISGSLHLVCTNGNRDKCCAKFGLEIYQEMATHHGDNVWQTTHLGGHRFAATAVSLPQGIVHGRIETGRSNELLSDIERGIVHVETYRGRACYDEHVQAADYYLRSETGITELDGLTLQHIEKTRLHEDQPPAVHRFVVTFAGADGMSYSVIMDERVSTFGVYKNSDKPNAEVVPQYMLLEITASKREVAQTD
jgi:hypothetical protein